MLQSKFIEAERIKFIKKLKMTVAVEACPIAFPALSIPYITDILF